MSLAVKDAPNLRHFQSFTEIQNRRPRDIYLSADCKYGFFGDGTFANRRTDGGIVCESSWLIPAKIMRLYENPFMAARQTANRLHPGWSVKFDFDLYSTVFKEFFECEPDAILECLCVDTTHHVVQALLNREPCDRFVMSVMFEWTDALKISCVSFELCEDGRREVVLKFMYPLPAIKITRDRIASGVQELQPIKRWTTVSGQLSDDALRSILWNENRSNDFNSLLIDGNTRHVIFDGTLQNSYGFTAEQIKTFYGARPTIHPDTGRLVVRANDKASYLWVNNKPTVVDVCTVLWSLLQNTEALLAIINWLPRMWLFSRTIKVRAIDSTAASARRVINNRTVENKKQSL